MTHNQGFSLIEMMIVVTILAVLSLLSYTFYDSHRQRASFIAALQETTHYVVESAKDMGMSSTVFGTCSTTGSYDKRFTGTNRIVRIYMYGMTVTQPDGSKKGTCVFKALISNTEGEGVGGRVIQLQLSGDTTFVGKRCFSTADENVLTKDCRHVDSITFNRSLPLV